MDSRKVRFVISGLFLLGLGAYNLFTYTSTQSYQSTFNLLSGQTQGIPATLRSGIVISGQFQETSGRPVSFYVESSAQYASFQTGTFVGSLYAVENVPSGSISYTTSTQDTFYLLFRHGAGLVDSTETVYFQRTYLFHDPFRLSLGILFLGIAAVDFYIGFRPRKIKAAVAPPISPVAGPDQGTAPGASFQGLL